MFPIIYQATKFISYANSIREFHIKAIKEKKHHQRKNQLPRSFSLALSP